MRGQSSIFTNPEDEVAIDRSAEIDSDCNPGYANSFPGDTIRENLQFVEA